MPARAFTASEEDILIEFIQASAKKAGFELARVWRDAKVNASQFSKFMNRKGGLSRAKVADILRVFDTTVDQVLAPREAEAPDSILKFCTNGDCRGAWLESVGDEPLIYPAVVRVPPEGVQYCVHCGTPLERACVCGVPLMRQEGNARCAKCGESLAIVPRSLRGLTRTELENECLCRNWLHLFLLNRPVFRRDESNHALADGTSPTSGGRCTSRITLDRHPHAEAATRLRPQEKRPELRKQIA